MERRAPGDFRYPYFPLFVNLEEKRVLVVGAGRIASRRIGALLGFGCQITVIAPKARREVEECERIGLIRWIRREFEPEDVEGAFLALAATDDEEVNDAVAAQCRKRRIPVNHAGRKELCDFYFPGIAREGGVVVGVTASGGDHGLAKRLVERVRKMLGEMM